MQRWHVSGELVVRGQIGHNNTLGHILRSQPFTERWVQLDHTRRIAQHVHRRQLEAHPR